MAPAMLPPPRVPAWPDALRSYLQHGRKQIPITISAMSLGTGILADRPTTECRQLELEIDHGDFRGFRFIALGIPLRARTDDPFLWVVRYDDGGIDGELVLAVCETRVRFRDWPAFDQVIFRNEGEPITGRPTDHGRKLTKTQARKLDQAARLHDALLDGRVTLRGRPHEERAVARGRLLEAARRLEAHRRARSRPALMDAGAAGSVDGVADLLRRAGWTLRDLEDELGKSPNLAHAGSSDVSYR